MTMTADRPRLDPLRWPDLIQVLRTLRSLHEQLLAAVRDKLDALRRADLPALGEATRTEQDLVRRIHEREGLRRQLMDLIGEQLQLPGRKGRQLTAGELAERLPAAQADTLRHEAAQLRAVMDQVVKANRTAGTVSRRVLEHFEAVFAAVTQPAAPATGYAAGGARDVTTGTALLEAVG